MRRGRVAGACGGACGVCSGVVGTGCGLGVAMVAGWGAVSRVRGFDARVREAGRVGTKAMGDMVWW